MVSCDGPWAGPLMVFLLLIAPFGLPLVVLALTAARRRWAQWLSLVIALVGLVAFAIAVRDHPADPRWIPLLFAPPLLAWSIALRTRKDTPRRWAVAAAFVPLLGGIVYLVWLTATYVPCFS